MRRVALAAFALFLAAAPAAVARPSYALRLDATGFTPAELQVPAGRRIVLRVTNAGTGPAEFESSDLNRERVVPSGQTIRVYVGPLRPGTYVFFDDFHPRLRGRLVAK